MIQQPTGTKIGKYEIRAELGRGAMGVVYVAHDPVLDRRVALKVMAANILEDPDLKERFRREAQAVAKLQSPQHRHRLRLRLPPGCAVHRYGDVERHRSGSQATLADAPHLGAEDRGCASGL